MREKIYVLSESNQWKVKCNHCKKEQPTGTQAEAIRIARQHVASLSEGTLAQILVQGQNGQWRTEWTYGKDPFPPRG